MPSILKTRKTNIDKDIKIAFADFSKILGSDLRVNQFMNEQKDAVAIKTYLNNLESNPDLIKNAKTVNMRLIHSPYNQARMGHRNNEHILEMLRDRHELALLRIDSFIEALGKPFGEKTTKVVMGKYSRLLKLMGEKEILKWSKK